MLPFLDNLWLYHKDRLLIGLFIFLIITIPLLSLLVSWRTKADKPQSLLTLKPVTSSKEASPTPSKKPVLFESATSTAGTPELATSVSFGPTLNFKIVIEGRPSANQAARVFIGIAAGSPSPSATPSYILSFNVDVPATGLFSGISLAGLSAGSTYTAILKSPSQIATASAFIMKPNETYLNNGVPLTLLSGDLNEDNVINSADFAVIKNSYSAKKDSGKWNGRADFNLDGIINSVDVGYIIKNFGRSGKSGAWYSSPPVATSSAKPASGSGTPSGYWLWVPQ